MKRKIQNFEKLFHQSNSKSLHYVSRHQESHNNHYVILVEWKKRWCKIAAKPRFNYIISNLLHIWLHKRVIKTTPRVYDWNHWSIWSGIPCSRTLSEIRSNDVKEFQPILERLNMFNISKIKLDVPRSASRQTLQSNVEHTSIENIIDTLFS